MHINYIFFAFSLLFLYTTIVIVHKTAERSLQGFPLWKTRPPHEHDKRRTFQKDHRTNALRRLLRRYRTQDLLLAKAQNASAATKRKTCSASTASKVISITSMRPAHTFVTPCARSLPPFLTGYLVKKPSGCGAKRATESLSSFTRSPSFKMERRWAPSSTFIRYK